MCDKAGIHAVHLRVQRRSSARRACPRTGHRSKSSQYSIDSIFRCWVLHFVSIFASSPAVAGAGVIAVDAVTRAAAVADFRRRLHSSSWYRYGISNNPLFRLGTMLAPDPFAAAL